MDPTNAPIFNDVNLLGQSITLLPGEHDPLHVDVMDLKKSTVVKLSTETYPVQFGDGKIYKLPKNTKSSQGHRVTHTNSLKVARGAELAYELGTEASISGSYAGFSASASAQYSYSGSMSVNKIYAILSVNHTSFTLDLEGHEGTDKMVSAEFVAAAKRLPEWQVKKEIYNEYVQFFRNWGTHVIDSCTFGARYQLKVENSSVESKSKESFQAQVSAEYNGIGSVKGDASLKKSDEYANYLKTRVAQATVTGGSSGSGIILSDPPSDPEEYRKAFDAWANSLDKAFSTNLVNARINSIGHLLANSSIEEHRAVSSKLVKALDYLASMRVVSGLVKVLGGKPRDLNAAVDSRLLKRTLGIHGAPGVSVKGETKATLELVYWRPYHQSPANRSNIVPNRGDEDELSVFVPISASVNQISANSVETIPRYLGIDSLDKSSKDAFAKHDYLKTWVNVSFTFIVPPKPVEVTLSRRDEKAEHWDWGFVDLRPEGPKLYSNERTHTWKLASLQGRPEFVEV